jgi:hypothetical protein
VRRDDSASDEEERDRVKNEREKKAKEGGKK